MSSPTWRGFIVDSVETELGLYPTIGINMSTDLGSDTLIDKPGH